MLSRKRLRAFDTAKPVVKQGRKITDLCEEIAESFESFNGVLFEYQLNLSCFYEEVLMEKRSGVLMVLGALSLGMVAFTPTVSSASPANFGFEDGLTSWALSLNGGTASVVPTYNVSLSLTFSPYEGTSFLLLSSGNVGQSAKVSQAFAVNAGETISGSYAFYAPSGNSDYSLAILTEGDDLVESLVNTQGVVSTNWSTWSWTASSSSTYKLSYSLKNIADNGTTSYAMFDATPVPIPGAVVLLGSALMGLLGIGSRKNRSGLV